MAHVFVLLAPLQPKAAKRCVLCATRDLQMQAEGEANFYLYLFF